MARSFELVPFGSEPGRRMLDEFSKRPEEEKAAELEWLQEAAANMDPGNAADACTTVKVHSREDADALAESIKADTEGVIKDLAEGFAGVPREFVAVDFSPANYYCGDAEGEMEGKVTTGAIVRTRMFLVGDHMIEDQTTRKMAIRRANIYVGRIADAVVLCWYGKFWDRIAHSGWEEQVHVKSMWEVDEAAAARTLKSAQECTASGESLVTGDLLAAVQESVAGMV